MSGADFGRHLNVVRTDDSQLHLPYSGAQAI
jgi:hypothetical protein